MPRHLKRSPHRGFGEQENEGIYFRGIRGKRSKIEGHMGTKTILGTGNIGNPVLILRNTGESDLFQGNKEQVL